MEDDILAFASYSSAGLGDNNQEQIRKTTREPDGLEGIAKLLGGSGGLDVEGGVQGAAEGFLTGGTAGAVAGGIGGALGGGAKSYEDVMPKRPPKCPLTFSSEQERVVKRNVLPGYDSDKDTYPAETIETIVPRLMTHEPCIEHEPLRWEDKVDEKGRLQAIFTGENVEGEDYIALGCRNVENHFRYDT